MQESFSRLSAPTLLIVGNEDIELMHRNPQALELIPGEKHLASVPGAAHLSAGAGALEQVADLASQWFSHYLRPTWLIPKAA